MIGGDDWLSRFSLSTWHTLSALNLSPSASYIVLGWLVDESLLRVVLAVLSTMKTIARSTEAPVPCAQGPKEAERIRLRAGDGWIQTCRLLSAA